MRLSLVFAFVTLAGCDCSEDTHSALGPDGGWDPYDAGPDSGPPPGNGVGEPCVDTSECRDGLDCDSESQTCQPVPDGVVGTPCTLTGECLDGLYCSATGTCQAAGDGAEGDACGGDQDCQRGLYCELRGLAGTCAPAGTGDWGDDCVETGDCLAGLWCGSGGTCEPPPLAFNPWGGVDCPPEDENPVAYFEVPRTGVDENEFFRLPFPNDIRVVGGLVDLATFPTPGPGLLGVDLVDLYKNAISSEMGQFGTNQPALFRFSKRFDPDTLVDAGGGERTVVLVDITVGSPTYAAPRGWYGRWGARSNYVCGDWYGVGPSAGFPGRPATTYAMYLTTALAVHPDEGGGAYQRDEDFVAMLDDAVPGDTDLAAAHAKYATFRQYLDAQAIPRDSILTAAVFTTQDVRSVPSQLRDRIRAVVAPPATSDAMLCDGVASSVCLDGGDPVERECGAVDAGFHEIHGHVTNPVMQDGERPYEETGGAILTDGLGMPQVQGSEDICYALAVPKGVSMPAAGWPVVLYSHGTGGNFRSALSEGVAGELATVALAGGGTTNFAVLGYDGAMHGSRRGGSDRPEDELFFNVTNPWAARDNVVQGAADLFQLVRFVEGLNIAAASSPTGEDIRFDPTRIYFLGHSQGSTVGALFAPYEPGVDVAVFSGAGALLVESLRHKTSPFNILVGLSVLLQDPVDNLSQVHPVLGLFQSWFERSDAVNYARLLVVEPAPGMSNTHFMQTWGEGDTYSPPETLNAFARAARADQVNPVFGDDIALTDPLDAPVTSNFECPGTPNCTAVLLQYDPAGGYDGHFVLQRHADAARQYTNFFGTASISGTNIPTLVP